MEICRASLQEMDGIYRDLRTELGVEAFGMAALVLPPGTEQIAHDHEDQDEVYFVHRGRAGFEVGGERFELSIGDGVHVDRVAAMLRDEESAFGRAEG